MSESPVEHALSLLVSGQFDAALRWSAAALESDAASPVALVVTARALWRLGHERAAIDAYTAAARRGARTNDAPLAIAALAELRAAGVDPEKLIDEVAAVVCRESLGEPALGEQAAWRGSLQPVSPVLTRRALVSRATQLVYEAGGAQHPQSTTTAFFGALSPATFRELVMAFEAIVVPAGFRAVEEGLEIQDVYVVASGEVELSRRGERSGEHVLATLESGAMFGEMAMLARSPAASSAVTTCPSILLVASRAAVELLGDGHADLRLELGAHCRRQAVGNLGSACSFMTTVPVRERAALVDRMVSRVYAGGERLVHAGNEALGLHLLLSGEVALVGREGTERVVLSKLKAGEVVGEAELVLCRRADTDAIAVCPTATLFLPRDGFFELALDYPAILHGLYSAAVRRVGDMGEALESRTAVVVDAEVQLDDAPILRTPEERSRPSSPPPLALASASVAADPGPQKDPASPPAPSLAPVTVSSLRPPVPRPESASRPATASRTSFARRSAQGAAVVAVAASVAAVLATRDDRPSTASLPQTHAAAAGEAPLIPDTYSPATAASSRSVASMEAAALKLDLDNHAPAATSATTPAPARQSTKVFLTSSLTKRRPLETTVREGSPTTGASAAPAVEPPATTASAAPAAPSAVPHPLPSAAAVPVKAEPRGENEFGGRE